MNNYLFKIVLIGPCNSGKSSMVFRYTDDIFDDQYYSTIGLDFKVKTILNGEHRIKIQIWDTAGQEKFKSITNTYYRIADIILLVFDLTQQSSFDEVEDWYQEALSYCKNEVFIILVGNKVDNDNSINKVQINKLVSKLNIDYFETSAKDNINIDELFTFAINKLLTKHNLKPLEFNITDTPLEPTVNKKNNCCHL